MFKKTNTSFAKWEVIKADKKIYARIKTLELILKNIPYDKKTEIHSEEINFQKSFIKSIIFKESSTENSPIFVLLSSVKCAPDFSALPKSFINDRI